MESDRVSNDARSCQKSVDLSDDQKEDNRHPQRVCPIIELRKRNQNRRDIANDVSDVRNDPEERESEPDQKAKLQALFYIVVQELVSFSFIGRPFATRARPK